MNEYEKANIIIQNFLNHFTDLSSELTINAIELAILRTITTSNEQLATENVASSLKISNPEVIAYTILLLSKGYINKQDFGENQNQFYVVPTDLAIECVNEFDLKITERIHNIETKLGTIRFEQLLTLLKDAY